jgi:hypothetical protein
MAPRDGGRPSATQSGLEVFGLCNWGYSMRSAMRHTHPHAVTLVLSGYPELQEAMSAILLQADNVRTLRQNKEQDMLLCYAFVAVFVTVRQSRFPP